MTKTIWTQTTKEFKAKWTDKHPIDLRDAVDMISDLLAIVEALETKVNTVTVM